MRKIILTLFLISTLVFVFKVKASPVQNIIRKEIKPTIAAIKNEVKPTIAQIREETRQEIRERLNQATSPSQAKEIRQEVREENRGLLEQIKNQVKEKLQNLRFSARINGKITSLSGNTMGIEDKNGKSYTVNITEKTQLRRRFWGKATLSEFSVGDEVNVIGRFIDEEKTTIEAILIRNLSIQKRWGVFFGEVVSVNNGSLTIKTVNRGDLTIYITSSTKLINRRQEKINLNQIAIGHKIRVKGVWDKTLNEIKETNEIKDFSLPPLPTKNINQ